jgi:hypothetical protein
MTFQISSIKHSSLNTKYQIPNTVSLLHNVEMYVKAECTYGTNAASVLYVYYILPLAWVTRGVLSDGFSDILWVILADGLIGAPLFAVLTGWGFRMDCATALSVLADGGPPALLGLFCGGLPSTESSSASSSV